ncbi:MAG: DUF3108 domain-containing protein [Proteobacteria bacterium]|nr:DUF3108 domain-containing protein [Pseudomonadota bacterium]
MLACLLPLLVLLALTKASPALEPPPTLASLQGETLEFSVRWGPLPAATASLAVLPAGDGVVKFRASARTLAYIDTVYPVRDQIESTVRLLGPAVLRYRKIAKDGWGKSREDEIRFDDTLGLARAFRNGNPRKTLLVPPGVQDPLSCFYAYRALDLPGDEVARLDITDGSRLVTGTVAVLKRETVQTPAGTFRTVLVEPRIEGIGGVFRKSPNARILIWLTDDGWRRPVKLQSEVAVGSFTAELIRLDHPAPPLPGP